MAPSTPWINRDDCSVLYFFASLIASLMATASGTFQYAAVRWFYDVSQLGAVTTKGVSPVPWEGNPGIRTAEGPSSNINAVGLQNPGVDHYLEDDLPKLKAINATVIANVAGHCDDDYAEVVSKLDDSPADMLEINVSCPNVSAGGMSVGTDPVALSRLITRLRKLTDKKMIVKLTPNVTDITVPARAAVEHGADALSMINTLKGMRITIRTGKPIIANVTGGVSGPAVLPVGLAAVYRVRTALPEIPIIGLGGIDSGEKALEYLYAGANAVEVGAAALFDVALNQTDQPLVRICVDVELQVEHAVQGFFVEHHDALDNDHVARFDMHGLLHAVACQHGIGRDIDGPARAHHG